MGKQKSLYYKFIKNFIVFIVFPFVILLSVFIGMTNKSAVETAQKKTTKMFFPKHPPTCIKY